MKSKGVAWSDRITDLCPQKRRHLREKACFLSPTAPFPRHIYIYAKERSWRDTDKAAFCEPESQLLPETELARTFLLDFPDSRTVRNKNLWVKPQYLWYCDGPCQLRQDQIVPRAKLGPKTSTVSLWGSALGRLCVRRGPVKRCVCKRVLAGVPEVKRKKGKGCFFNSLNHVPGGFLPHFCGELCWALGG